MNPRLRSERYKNGKTLTEDIFSDTSAKLAKRAIETKS